MSIDTLADLSWVDAAVDNYAAVARRASIVDESTVRDVLSASGTVLFEGAQGVLLDESYGFHPHTSWSTTTFADAEEMLEESRFDGARARLGVLRTYFTRHGPGPFVTEVESLRTQLPEPHNADAGWQGRFRVGHFDAVAARYALAAAGGVDGLAVTHVDRPPVLPRLVCTAYWTDRPDSRLFEAADGSVSNLRVPRPEDLAHLARVTDALRHCRPAYAAAADDGDFLDLLRRQTGSAIALTSSGPTWREKRVAADAAFL